MRALLIIVTMLAGCDKTPPLPPELPKPDADLMVAPSATPLPALPENKRASVGELYAHQARVLGQCVSDRRRLADLQKYVGKLTRN